jgi:hypothetical protein
LQFLLLRGPLPQAGQGGAGGPAGAGHFLQRPVRAAEQLHEPVEVLTP